MNEDHEQDKPEPVDDVIEITNQQTAAVPTTHTSCGNLLSHVTQLATTRKDHVTFWSLPREIRDMIWSEVLGPEDDIFQANVITSVCDTAPEESTRPHIRYETSRYARRGDGRFDKIDHAPILLSSRPPLPLAHLCQESRAFALQKYDAAYSKVRGPDLNQEREERFRWLSRHAPRLLTIDPNYGVHDEADIKAPLGEDEPLILFYRQKTCEAGNQDSRQHTELWLLELLKKAKDYQILICPCDLQSGDALIDRDIARKWGVFADRAPGEDFAKDRATDLDTQIFVAVQVIFPMVQLLRDINKSGSRPLEEEELFCGDPSTVLEDREWNQVVFSRCLGHLKRLLAKNVDQKEISSQSRYGRMPKIGHAFEYDTSLTWSETRHMIDAGSETEDSIDAGDW